MQLLQGSELQSGLIGWGATDVDVFTQRLARVMLSQRPPRHYQDAFLWRLAYYFGNYAPLWAVDLYHRVRLQLY
jgi:hypothetical protein